MSAREVVRDRGERLAVEAFDAGVLAVLRVVFDNCPMSDAGVGGALRDEDLERVRWLRQQVWGKRAYDYRPGFKKPQNNSLAGARIAHAQHKKATGTP